MRRPGVLPLLLRWRAPAAGLLFFASLAVLLETGRLPGLDRPLLRFLLVHRSAWLTRVMIAFSWVGDGAVLALVVLVSALWLWPRDRRAALYLAVSGAGAGLIDQVLKLLFARSRPPVAWRLVAASSYSFPSGHSMGSAAVYAALGVVVWLRLPRARRPVACVCTLLIAGIGVSRAYLYVHYPSDVLAGWALGLSWVIWLRPLFLSPGSR